MKRIFIASRGNPEHLANLFRAELPEHEVLVAQPQPGDAPVQYAVVGRPQPGVISSVPGLELVLSLNAGIEHLLSSGEIPAHLPIVRLVDDGLALGMSEWVLAEALAWHRNLRVYEAQQSRKDWTQQSEKLARERKVTVLGAGALGMADGGALRSFRLRDPRLESFRPRDRRGAVLRRPRAPARIRVGCRYPREPAAPDG